MELIEAFPRLLSWAVPIIILAIIVFPQLEIHPRR